MTEKIEESKIAPDPTDQQGDLIFDAATRIASVEFGYSLWMDFRTLRMATIRKYLIANSNDFLAIEVTLDFSESDEVLRSMAADHFHSSKPDRSKIIADFLDLGREFGGKTRRVK